MGQGVVWYTGQFYAQTFLLKTCNIEATQANSWIGIALLFATPFFIVFGWLSDRIGRKSIMLGGMLLAVICYRPIFSTMYDMSDVKAKVIVDTKTEEKKLMNKSGIDSIIITTTNKSFEDGSKILITEKKAAVKDAIAIFKTVETKKALTLDDSYRWKYIVLIFILVLFVTMVYGPIAAFLVELFPTKIRYTSMSLPYHIGNGVFGGLVPFIATLITVSPGSNPLSGLWYPIGIASLCFIIGLLYLSKNKQH
jgi:MHS family proline/betaine transporter-like MFS transporter